MNKNFHHPQNQFPPLRARYHLRFQILASAFLCSALSFSAYANNKQAESTKVGNGPEKFSFSVISHPSRTTFGEQILRNAIKETDKENLAFVVTNGIKSSQEPCTDKLFDERKNLINIAKNGLIVSLPGSDWANCKNSNGHSAAMDRLGRIREVFFDDEFSFGASRIPITRQSTSPKFSSYVENARWEIGDVVFATINLPAKNNLYLSDSGRNSEFEDRSIANRDWLRRIFFAAAQNKADGIVLFADGDPLMPQRHKTFDFATKHDGFAEIRKTIYSLAFKFPGKVLLIHGPSSDTSATATTSPTIVWQKNLGDLEVASSWIKITVDERNKNLFVLGKKRVERAKNLAQ